MFPFEVSPMAPARHIEVRHPPGPLLVPTHIRAMDLTELSACLMAWWEVTSLKCAFLPMSLKLRHWRHLRET
jgi:hypothetical protein